LLSKTPLYLNASRLESVGEGDARNRFAKAAQELIRFAYPSLKMLKGTYDETTLSKTLLDPSDLLEGIDLTLSEAEQEILTYVARNQNSGERVSVEEIIRQFGKRPCGWYPMAVLTFIARLFRLGKVELRTTDLLDARAALDALKNTRQHGAVRVRLQEQFSPATVAALKRFHQELFDQMNDATDARSVAQLTSDMLIKEGRELRALQDQQSRYPFLGNLEPVIRSIEDLGGKYFTHLLNNLADFQDELLTAKGVLLDPIKAFMKGPQRKVYDEAMTFLREEEANFAEVSTEDIAPLRLLATSVAPYRGTVIPDAKAAVTLVRALIDTKLTEERLRSTAVLEEHETKLKAVPDFARLSDPQKTQVLQKSDEIRQSLQSARFISTIRDRLARYTSTDYPAQLALLNRLATPKPRSCNYPENTGDKPTGIAEARFISAASLKAECGLTYLATEEDLDRWLEALRKIALAEIKKGVRISL